MSSTAICHSTAVQTNDSDRARLLTANTVISMERFQVRSGVQHLYTVTVFGDGLAVFSGEHNVDSIGTSRTQLSIAQVQPLLQDFRDSGVFDAVEDVTPQRSTECHDSTSSVDRSMDHFVTNLSLQVNGIARAVSHDSMCQGPRAERLKALENAVEQAVGPTHWTAPPMPLGPKKLLDGNLTALLNPSTVIAFNSVGSPLAMFYPSHWVTVFGDGLYILQVETGLSSRHIYPQLPAGTVESPLGYTRGRLSRDQVLMLLQIFRDDDYFGSSPADAAVNHECAPAFDLGVDGVTLQLSGARRAIGHRGDCWGAKDPVTLFEAKIQDVVHWDGSSRQLGVLSTSQR